MLSKDSDMVELSKPLSTRAVLLQGAILLAVLFALREAPAADKPEEKSTEKPAASAPAKRTDGLTPLNKQETVLLDVKGKRVLLKTKVVLREGFLEMFCCLAGSKEHESILSLDAKAYVVHTGLLAVGAKPGTPVQFEPKYSPPTGQRIDVFVQWTDDKGKLQRVPAQSWVRHALHKFYVEKVEKLPADLTIPKEDDDLNLKYLAKFKELSWYGPMSVRQRDKLLKLSSDAGYRKIIEKYFEQTRPRELDAHFVFAGSGFAKNTQTGEEFYAAEGGDLICVANFSTATLDVSIKSSANQEEGILFEPYTERLPPVGTEVTVELIPVFDQKEKGAEKK